MTSKASKPRRRIGRPPAGARAGEKVKDYPQLSIRLPGEVKAKLQALSLISARPQWRHHHRCDRLLSCASVPTPSGGWWTSWSAARGRARRARAHADEYSERHAVDAAVRGAAAIGR